MRAERPLGPGRGREQLRRTLRRQLVGRQVLGDARPLLAALHVGAVPADSHDDVRARDGDRVHLARVDSLEVVGHERAQARVTVAEVEAPSQATRSSSPAAIRSRSSSRRAVKS